MLTPPRDGRTREIGNRDVSDTGELFPEWVDFMATTYVTTVNTGAGPVFTPASGDTIFVSDTGLVGSTAGDAIAASSISDFNLFVDGTVFGDSSGVDIISFTGNFGLAIGAGGRVSANNYGVFVTGSEAGEATVLNEGTITSNDDSLVLYGFDLIEVANTGFIGVSASGNDSYKNAVFLGATTTRIVNHGTIQAQSDNRSYIDVAITGYTNGASDEMFTVLNTGNISGPAAIITENKIDHVANTGVIEGLVNIGSTSRVFFSEDSHNDVFENSGTVIGDVLLGGGDDQFLGETGQINGTIYAGSGNDIIKSGIGDDIINGGTGRDKMYGGAGNDTATYEDSSAGVRVSLTTHRGRGGEATGDWLFDIENLIGSNYDDTLIGDAVSNILEGGDGADTLNGEGADDLLFGGSGDDTLIGGDGNDILNGGLDRDILWGGEGADIFEFLDVAESGTGSSRDVIKDFEQGVDLIDLAAMGASSFSAGGFTNTAGEVTYKLLSGGTKTVIEYDHDGDGAADFQILMTNGGFTMTSDDFILG